MWCWRDVYPFALVLNIEPGTPSWVFARDLVALGLREPTGDGDVHVRPVRSCVQVVLSPPSGRAVLTYDRTALAAYLAATEDIVPPDREHEFFDVDGELSRAGVLA
ncbi:hypothetical protein B1813_18840 [Saccharomonospora piscinae]|uniref:Sporulation and cell division protein, SsgA n=2 Tax=Saccharomonospora piscinae TaxID=687388 RepID=A0A1V8ZZB7_SACPI|nr:hypothetical protein B1813_18840 [Saccharomonospora piscinae]